MYYALTCSFCRSVAEKLQVIVEDARHYLKPSKQEPKQTILLTGHGKVRIILHVQ